MATVDVCERRNGRTMGVNEEPWEERDSRVGRNDPMLQQPQHHLLRPPCNAQVIQDQDKDKDMVLAHLPFTSRARVSGSKACPGPGLMCNVTYGLFFCVVEKYFFKSTPL